MIFFLFPLGTVALVLVLLFGFGGSVMMFQSLSHKTRKWIGIGLLVFFGLYGLAGIFTDNFGVNDYSPPPAEEWTGQ